MKTCFAGVRNLIIVWSPAYCGGSSSFGTEITWDIQEKIFIRYKNLFLMVFEMFSDTFKLHTSFSALEFDLPALNMHKYFSSIDTLLTREKSLCSQLKEKKEKQI
ncbi:hypothetical protein Ddye_016019 [Dipteronia dyeriana]|uniref:Uncharacterized protein n=1 Tax=Dipteronia dyeriana TaxID=168575 RepID=A0AAD9U5Z1_9ROSI|nr:hypothetical protein Ddye_016019 [Dipteronia dyeriana]